VAQPLSLAGRGASHMILYQYWCRTGNHPTTGANQLDSCLSCGASL